MYESEYKALASKGVDLMRPFTVEPDPVPDVNTPQLGLSSDTVRTIKENWPFPMRPLGPNMEKSPPRDLPPNPKQAYGDQKVALHLIPPASLIHEATAFEEGARKYGAYNWRTKAVEAMTYIGATQRHLLAYLDGEEIDPESGLLHLALAKACLGILIDATEIGNLLDNRPAKGTAGALLRKLKRVKS